MNNALFLELSLYLKRSRTNLSTSGGQIPREFLCLAIATTSDWKMDKLQSEVSAISALSKVKIH